MIGTPKQETRAQGESPNSPKHQVSSKAFLQPKLEDQAIFLKQIDQNPKEVILNEVVLNQSSGIALPEIRKSVGEKEINKFPI